jgi:hypothetical protein
MVSILPPPHPPKPRRVLKPTGDKYGLDEMLDELYYVAWEGAPEDVDPPKRFDQAFDEANEAINDALNKKDYEIDTLKEKLLKTKTELIELQKERLEELKSRDGAKKN